MSYRFIESGTCAPDALDTSERILIIGGLGLIVAGLIAGEVFALFLSHALNADLRAAWMDVLAMSGNSAAEEVVARFKEIKHLATERAQAMSLHSHTGPYGLLAAGVGLAKNRWRLVHKFDVPAAILVLAGAIVQSIGFLTLDYETGGWISLSNAGALLLLAGLVLLILPFIAMTVPTQEPPAPLPERSDPGGLMLRLGVLVVFAGLLFGMYLAWRHVFHEEPALHAALGNLIAAIQSRDTAVATELYGTYKSKQITMAITAASHSHTVAFGFIMIVSALLAGHLGRTTATWRNTAFVLIAVGGLLLPVFVYLAPRFGYFYALCADTAGGLVIIGLLIIIAGLFSTGEAKQ